MNRRHSDRKKVQVSKDFDDTLQTIIRSLSREEIAMIDAYEKKDVDSNDLYMSLEDSTLSHMSSSDGLVKRTSIFRSKSIGKYELVVSRPPNLGSKKPSQESDNVSAKVYTRPIPEKKETVKGSKKPKSKSSNYLFRFLPALNYAKIPFERTTISSLPFHLKIDFENKEIVTIPVTEFQTIDTVKSKISKTWQKFPLNIDQQALFFKDERLEGKHMLCTYGISSSSRLQLKICEPITIIGIFETLRIESGFYTSVTVDNIKKYFSQKININKKNIELKYNGSMLDESKELFVYDVLDGSEIEIVHVVEENIQLGSPGHRTVDSFHHMTDDLTKCKCNEIRIKVISDLFMMYLSRSTPEDEIKKNRQLLSEFLPKKHYHHFSCFKLLPKDEVDRNASQNSYASEFSTSYSGSDSSLKSAVFAENKRLDRHESLKIQSEYIKLIAECTEFKVFKHLLKGKIGNKCNLRSVALLYKYTRETVRFIGLDDNENVPEVSRILDFTKLYFEKYFKKAIIEKGGLDALTLTGSDVD